MATSYDGGIGGKLRKRAFRRPSTPYDRPPTALPNPSNSDQRNWVSKLIDPASRIISGRAARLFSSVFRKRLPPPAPLPEANLEPRNELPGEVCTNPSGAKDQGNGEGENQKQSFESSGINEIEQLLKQKTFTRVEFERLIELLRSRTVNLPKDHENKRTEPSISQLVAAQARDEQLTPAQENRGESRISTPTATGGFLVPEEEAATPADIAKAYMGSRPSKLSPSSLGFRSQILREDPPLLNIMPFALKSPNMLRAPRSSRHFSGVAQLSENRYMTPRPLRRSAIYSMARSPYTKAHSIAIHKGAEPSDDAYAGSLQSHWTQVDKTLNGGKQVLKRTRSVLDDDSGSVGPMRKIRQKSGLTSPSMYNVPGSPFSSPQTPVGSYSVWGSISTMKKPLSLDGPKDSISKLQAAENGDYKLSTTSSAFVPNQSSKIAMKIMQQLDKLVPSPNEKLFESKVAIAANEFNLDMSNGRPFKSTENKHSPRLQNAKHSGTLDGVSGTQLPASGNSLSEKQERVEVNSPVKNVDIGIRSSSVADSVKNTVKGTLSDARPVDSVILGFSANLPLNKRALQMSAPVKDVVELEDDNCSSKITSTSHAAEKVESESYISECETIVAKTVKVEKRVASSERKPAVAENKGADTVSRSADCSIVPSIDAGFASTITSAADSVKPTPPMPPQLPSLFNKSTPKEQPVMTMFGSRSTNKGPAFTFSSTSNNINGTSGTKSIDSNCEIIKSTATEDTNPPEATGSGKNEKNLKGRDPKKSSENAITGISTSATPKIFSFGVSTNSNQSNGLFSVNAAPEAPIFGSSTSLIFHGSGAATSGCNSSSPMSTAVPVFSASSAFKFGAGNSSAATSTTATSSLVSADSELKTKQASLPLSTMGSSVLASTAASTHTTSSVFSFGSSVSSSCTASSFSASNLSQSSTFGATVGSAFGTASGITPSTQSMQGQFGSSSTPTFGLSGTSFGAASSPFGSSSSSSKLTSGSGSGLSSSMSSSASTGSFGSGAGFSFAPASMTASTSSFSLGFWQSTSIFGSGVGSTASATGFTFGVSAAASGSTPSTFGSPFGTSSGSLFSFTSATATTAASTSLSQAQPVFGTTNPAVNFGSASRVNDRIIEDSMAVDTVQASAPVTPPLAGPLSPSSSLNFGFGSAATPTIGPSAFQFGGHQNTATPQSPSTFPGGGFSVGSGGTDKSNRRIVKIKRDKHRKK